MLGYRRSDRPGWLDAKRTLAARKINDRIKREMWDRSLTFDDLAALTDIPYGYLQQTIGNGEPAIIAVYEILAHALDLDVQVSIHDAVYDDSVRLARNYEAGDLPVFDLPQTVHIDMARWTGYAHGPADTEKTAVLRLSDGKFLNSVGFACLAAGVGLNWLQKAKTIGELPCIVNHLSYWEREDEDGEIARIRPTLTTNRLLAADLKWTIHRKAEVRLALKAVGVRVEFFNTDGDALSRVAPPKDFVRPASMRSKFKKKDSRSGSRTSG